MQSRIFFVALSAILLSSQSGTAQETSEDRFHADLGYSRIGSDLLELDTQNQSLEFGGVLGRIGYRLSDHWSVEGEAITGVENDKQIYGGINSRFFGNESLTTSVRTDLSHLIGVYVKGTLPVTQKLNAFARVGIANANFEYSSEGSVTDIETQERITRTSNGS